jgi:hypothetical protein
MTGIIGITGIAAHPCKKRKDWHPRFRYGEEEHRVEGWASPRAEPDYADGFDVALRDISRSI